MRIISRSTGRKIFATVIVSLLFVFVYEATIRDSRYAARQAMLRETSGTPLPGTRLTFHATAYCKGTTTASGVNVRSGIAAADPSLLPVGSVVSINTGETKYSGIYTIMDTGPAVQGRTLDVYMWSCHEALAFGRKQVQVTVLRMGWNPRASTPGIVDKLFRSRQVKKPAPDTPSPAPVPAPEPPPALVPAPIPAMVPVPSNEPGSPVPPVPPLPDTPAMPANETPVVRSP